MPRKIVTYVIGCAYDLDSGALYKLPRREMFLLDSGICGIPYYFRVFFAYRQIYSEIHRQFHMRPMIKRIARRIFKCSAILCEFFFICGTTCYKAFVNSDVPHKAPFIMIAAEPHCTYIIKLLILVYFTRRQMTVIINHRQRSDFSIYSLCGITREQVAILHNILAFHCH